MSLKTYAGSCHCGAAHFDADIDLSKGTMRCNCSICSRARAWFAFVKPDQFRLAKGAENALAEYHWTPPGKPHANLHYYFCKICGIRVYARADNDGHGNPGVAVSVAALDGSNPSELAASIKYVDGRHDHFDRPPPEDTRAI